MTGDIDLLRRRMRYDPDTGRLFWKASNLTAGCWNSSFDGREALAVIDKDGYKHGTVERRRLLAHRVAWAIYHGEWPKGHMDHINHDRTDNRISNLRDVERVGNQRNLSKRTDNTSGVNGVGWHKQRQKWRAFAFRDGKHISLGLYADKNEAIAARKSFEANNGYHENHGLMSHEIGAVDALKHWDGEE